MKIAGFLFIIRLEFLELTSPGIKDRGLVELVVAVLQDTMLS